MNFPQDLSLDQSQYATRQLTRERLGRKRQVRRVEVDTRGHYPMMQDRPKESAHNQMHGQQ